jgi:1-acyl-sn-glycerol-3-phosphate acyltransferase
MTARRVGPVLRDLCVAWSGATMVAPRLAPPHRGRLAMRLARRTLRSLGVRVTVRGTPLPPDEPALIVANHVSWLDVYVLNALVDARFVAKSEVTAWPVVGAITRGFDAIFIVRDSARDAARVKTAVAAALRAGDRVVVFPEATTTDGTRLGRFHHAMFQAAIDAGVRVLPVALRYARPDGFVDTTPAFVGDMTFVSSLRRIMRASSVRAEVTFASPLAAEWWTRRGLASTARALVANALELPASAIDPVPARRRIGRRAA